MDTPIACTLSPADKEVRTRQLAALAGRALRDREPIPGGLRLRFDTNATDLAELRALATAEADCCPFLDFDLRAAGDAIVLDVTGPTAAQPIIAELLR